MRKCMTCRLIFELEERTRCLYCHTLLVQMAPDDEPKEFELFEENLGDDALEAKRAIIAQMIKDRRIKSHGRMQYIIGSYFRTRTLDFLHRFSRNEFKMGKGFSRALVQPLNSSHFFTLPWVIIDLFDSAWIRFFYNEYCDKCGWKYIKIFGGQQHDPKQCEYCHEYSRIVDDILTGRITQSERIFKEQALEKKSLGKCSAYHDLCSQREWIFSILDVMCVWFTITLMLSFFVILGWPMARFILRAMGAPDDEFL